MLLVFVYGRFLLQLKEGLFKSILLRVVLVLCTVPFALFGFWRGLDGWLVLPCLVWLCAAVIEIQRLILKRKHRAAGPVQQHVPRFSILKPFTTTMLAVRRYEVAVPCWSGGTGVRIAHISDIHMHRAIEESYFRHVMDRVVEWAPDTVFVTGDFVTQVKYAGLLQGVFRNLHAPLGVFASLGNHDHWTDPGLIRRELARSGLDVLSNSEKIVCSSSGNSLIVSGCEDPWMAREWLAPEHEADTPLVVLSHTADNIYRLSRADALAVFAGHYHAGQAAVPRYGSIVVPSKYGRRFDHGHFLVDRTHLFVTAGVGVAFPSFRIYCHPEIIIVDLVPAGNHPQPGL